jgi:hypothetical protein
MKPELKTITPEIALRMLELNTVNRPLTETNVATLVKEMKGGRWKINGDMIRLSVGNVIIDGQHRLHAVVRSGITIQTWVMEGLPSDVFDTIDVGKRRSSGDTLGCRGEQNSYRLAASLIMIDKYITGRVEKSVQYTNTEVEGLLVKYPEARKSLMTAARAKGLILPSVLDSCHYLFSQKDPALADVFVQKVLKGVGMEDGDPWYALRERMLINSISNTKLSKALMMALCIKAWNAARQGKRITKLQLNLVDGKMSAFPVIQ